MPIDYSKYPPNWKSEIRPRIIERAGNKCEICGVPNGARILRGVYDGLEAFQDEDGSIYSTETGECIGDDYLGEVDQSGKNKVIKIVLTVAHLDHDPENWQVEDDRLKLLCQLHHLRLDAPEKKKKRKAKQTMATLFPIDED